jgi:hypothetical protein
VGKKLAHSRALTADELAWLADVEDEWHGTTRGDWYAHLTDDAYFMNATYVSTVPGPLQLGFVVDGGTGMAAGAHDQAEHEQVIAITLLQEPRLADSEQSDENTRFIANVHQHIPRLLAMIRELTNTAHFREDP